MSVVIIPAYKPDNSLVTVADGLWTYGCRIVVVDDGSGKGYEDIFNKIKDICIILRHTENQGKGAAIKTALSYIKKEMWDNDCIGIMDSDGQHLPEDMMKLFEFMETHRNTLVLGARTIGKDMPWKSRLGNQITRRVFRLVSGMEVSDTQTGLRAFDSELTEKMLSVSGEKYEYEMNVLMACVKEGIPIEEVPISTIYRDKRNSNSHFRKVRDSIRIYMDILKFTLSSFSSFILDYVLFGLFMAFLPHTTVFALIANMAARLISAFYNYNMNCCFVFHTDKKIGTAVHYFALAGTILIMNSLILGILVQLLHIPVYPAKLMTECVLFLLSWCVQKHIIFEKDQCSRTMDKNAREESGYSTIHILAGGKAGA